MAQYYQEQQGERSFQNPLLFYWSTDKENSLTWREEKVLLQEEYKNLSDILKDMHIGEKAKKNLCGNCKNRKKINFILKESITWKRSTGKEEMTLYPQKSLPNICQQCQQCQQED